MSSGPFFFFFFLEEQELDLAKMCQCFEVLTNNVDDKCLFLNGLNIASQDILPSEADAHDPRFISRACATDGHKAQDVCCERAWVLMPAGLVL